MERKTLYDISWQVPESVYRKDPALSYSTLSKFERTGFNGLKNLFDKVETPSITFGQAVDSIITGGEEEFNERFIIAKFPEVKDSIVPIVKKLFSLYGEFVTDLNSINDENIIRVASEFNYQNNWKPETRARVIKESASEYYKLLHISQDKTIIDTETYQDVLNCVDALKNSDATKWYFQKDNPWDNIERFYQLKFKANIDGVDYRCMADEIICNHKSKHITLIDLKTSSKTEADFYKSFIEWKYSIQARLYFRIIEDNLKRDPYFRNFTISNYHFIVVNKYTLIPLIWEYEHTKAYGDLTYGRNKDIIVRDPITIGKELYYYLNNSRKVPVGINEHGINSLIKYLDEM